jgi:hypothetical protein
MAQVSVSTSVPTAASPRPSRLAQAWGLLPVRAFVLALVANLLVWGPFLSRERTVSLEAMAPSANFACRPAGPRLACATEAFTPNQVLDPGASTWVEMAGDYYLRRARALWGEHPSWNPYVGSGYPFALDGHNVRTSPTRWLLSRFPGDQGRDVLVFARFLLWTFGILLALGVAGAGTGIQAVAALAAAVAPYPATLVDHVMLDVDLLSPWFVTLSIAMARGLLSTRAATLGALALGVLVGLLGFVQAQAVACVAFGLVALAAARATRGRSLALAAAAGAGVLAIWPSWLPLVRNLDQFVSSRTAQCIIAEGLGAAGAWSSLWHPIPGEQLRLAVTVVGLAILPLVPRGLRFLVAALVVMVAWMVFGLPTWACRLPLLSGVRFVRHLGSHAQALFIVSVGIAAHELSRRLDRRWPPALLALAAAWSLAATAADGAARGARVGVGVAGALCAAGAFALARWGGERRWRAAVRQGAAGAAAAGLALSPYAFGSPIALHLWAGTAGGPELPALPERLDPAAPLAAVAAIAGAEDRRHYGIGGSPYPNWAAAFGIPDLLSLQALYPLGSWELNAGLFSGWEGDPNHGIVPDRFVPVPGSEVWSTAFQRVLVLNRVSLFTFMPGLAFFPFDAGSPYGRSRCKLVAKDWASVAEAWVCPEMGGIGYFPGSVGVVASRTEALARLAALAPADLTDVALLGPELDPALAGRRVTPGAGRVIGVDRRGDTLAYVLDVTRPGPFVVADTFFRGWTATVNGRPAPISRANVAFKAVLVPAGRVELVLRFATP